MCKDKLWYTRGRESILWASLHYTPSGGIIQDATPVGIRDCSKPVKNTTPDTQIIPKHPILLVMHLMYTLYLSMTSFKKAEPKRINVYYGQAAQEYKLTLPNKDRIGALQKK